MIQKNFIVLFSVLQVVLMLIGICCWLFWFCCYMSQMNPLIGPVLNQRTLVAVKEYWVSQPRKFIFCKEGSSEIILVIAYK